MAHTPVSVTQEDIDQGTRNNSSRCVVATAIARTFPKASRITVDVHSIRFTNGARRYTYLTPPKVMDYIVAFDAGDQLHPFTFRLRDEQRLVQQRQVATPAGKQVDRAKAATAYRRAKVARLEKEQATPTVIAVAREQLAVAEDKERAVRASVESQPKSKAEKPQDVPADQLKPRPRGRSTVFRRNERVYGARVMRVNHSDDQPGDFRGPLDDD